jgi:glutamate-5-semialdehyde dehydrogenase
VVFESRPGVVAQVGALALKSGNAVLMKGGSEAANSNQALMEAMRDGLSSTDIPVDCIQLIESREDVARMLQLDEYVSLVIPRGSNSFVKYVKDNTSIPVLGHADGICHMYVHEKADKDMAVKLVVDAKTQYPAVCNAIETLLVDEKVGGEYLPDIVEALKNKGVEVRGCEKTRAIVGVNEADEEDWSTEYNDLILSVKVVADLTAAVAHINKYGSGHTDAIVTEDVDAAREFMESVDSSSVMHNASTRFADGFRYGLGAEVGISTSKIHARGPVGLEGLVTYNWRLVGGGQTVSEYSGEDARKYSHKIVDKRW